MNSQEMRFATDAKKMCNFLLVRLCSRGDRYLSHSSRHTQVPVPATTEISLHRKMSLKPSPVLWRRVSYSPPVPPFTSAPRGCRKPRRTQIQLT